MRTLKKRYPTIETSLSANTSNSHPHPIEFGVSRTDVHAEARTHLANERTFLAWVRTSVSLFALGLAVALFYDKQRGLTDFELMLALGFSLGGIAIMLSGYRRYRIVQNRIRSGADCGRVSRTVGIASIAVVSTGLLVAVFVMVLALS